MSDEVYRLRLDGEYKSASSKDLFEWYQLLIEKYPIVSIEDPFSEEDWGGFASLNSASGKKVMIVGDDLTVTNVKRISEAVSKGAINTVLIKPNQIGTISETISAIQLTHASGWNSFVSHRSGETNDTFIADLAVGCGCGYIKSGSLARGERVCKYNRLMEIERLIQ